MSLVVTISSRSGAARAFSPPWTTSYSSRPSSLTRSRRGARSGRLSSWPRCTCSFSSHYRSKPTTLWHTTSLSTLVQPTHRPLQRWRTSKRKKRAPGPGKPLSPSLPHRRVHQRRQRNRRPPPRVPRAPRGVRRRRRGAQHRQRHRLLRRLAESVGALPQQLLVASQRRTPSRQPPPPHVAADAVPLVARTTSQTSSPCWMSASSPTHRVHRRGRHG